MTPAAGTAPSLRDRAWLRACWFWVVLLVLRGSAAHAQGAASDRFAIPPGEEPRIARLLGRGTSTGPCALREIQVARTRVSARYDCGARGPRVRIALAHPLDAGTSARQIGWLAVLVESGTEPLSTRIADAVLARAEQEASPLRWLEVEPITPPRTVASAAPPTGSRAPAPAARSLTTTRDTTWNGIDGFASLLAIALFLASAAWRALRRRPRAERWALLLIVASGAAYRLAFAPDTTLNVWPYTRVVPLADAVFRGPWLAALSRAIPVPFWFTDVTAATNLTLAVLAPLAVFTFVRALLADARAAIAAAALLALQPIHMHFARSDVQAIASVLGSPLTFTAVYGALADPSRRWRALCFALLPGAAMVTYLARPENLSFVVLDGLSIALVQNATWRRRLLAFALIAGTAAWVAHVEVLPRYAGNVRDGLTWAALGGALQLLLSPASNPLLAPWISPPWFVAAVLLGLVVLVRAQTWRPVLLLLAWTGMFFFAHATVRATHLPGESRYFLQALPPLCALAGASASILSSLAPPQPVILVALVLLSPLAHRTFLRDRAYSEALEYDFLRATRERIPAGCVVLEFQPDVGTSDPGGRHASRWVRVLAKVQRGGVRSDVWVVDAAAQGEPGHVERLSSQALSLLSSPPACLMVYEGLSCATHRPADVAEAPVCTALREAAQARAATLLASTRFLARRWDRPMNERADSAAAHLERLYAPLRDGEPVTLRLWRFR